LGPTLPPQGSWIFSLVVYVFVRNLVILSIYDTKGIYTKMKTFSKIIMSNCVGYVEKLLLFQKIHEVQAMIMHSKNAL
jgi:hypothetical protein